MGLLCIRLYSMSILTFCFLFKWNEYLRTDQHRCVLWHEGATGRARRWHGRCKDIFSCQLGTFKLDYNWTSSQLSEKCFVSVNLPPRVACRVKRRRWLGCQLQQITNGVSCLFIHLLKWQQIINYSFWMPITWPFKGFYAQTHVYRVKKARLLIFQPYSETLEGKETKNTAAAHLLSISRHQTPDVGNCSHVRTKCCTKAIWPQSFQGFMRWRPYFFSLQWVGTWWQWLPLEK